ncbi:MAG: class I SAM-dependent methyltransferase [Phycisphaera sp. RhM]|nr:class I SAM-dependent methyltransferase [Phycisphaera sp. RhM]
MNQADVLRHNRQAWDKLVERGDRWTKPVDRATIQRARAGKFAIVLTPTKPVPAEWFPPLENAEVLCLASAGGQQAPVLAAAGAKVTVFDNSPQQLDQDRLVAVRDGLAMQFVRGDMADLSVFADASFDLIFHPCSNTFVPTVIPVWRECARVLRTGGILMAGFTNPVRYLFDDERTENGNLEVRYALPYSDLDFLDEPHIKKAVEEGQPLEFGHTLEDQIGGQLSAGLLLSAFYEDRYGETAADPLSRLLDTFIATRAIKP